jgi:hypothetical protein
MGDLDLKKCLVSAQTRAATWEAVKPLGEADKAISASSTPRMRALLRSIPPTMVLPTREAARISSLLAEGRRGARRRPRRIGEFEDLRNRVGCTGLDRRNWQI